MKKSFSNTKLTWILVFVFILISFFPLFAFLGTSTLRTWDESRVATSSYEMTNTKNPLIVTFDYQPDHWSVKPPLAIWIQALSIKAFGVNETAVRLPSAIAIMLLGIVIILLTGVLKKPFLGFYASTVLICSKGILYYHTGRSADYDALLCLFMISYLLLFFVYTETKEKKYYKLFFIALILATLTKGVQALLPLPIIPLYVIFRKQFIALLKERSTYIGIGLFVLFVGGYYIARELMYSGYLKAVYQNELGGRVGTVIEGHEGGLDYYYLELYNNYFSYFIYLLPIAFLFNLFIKDKQARRLSIYSMSAATFIFIIITIAKTKIPWYNAPLLPLCGLVIGTSFYIIHNFLMGFSKRIPFISGLILIAYLLVFFTPYNDIVRHVHAPKEHPDYHPYYSRLEMMKNLAKKDIVVNDTIVYINQDNMQDFMFYYYAMNEKGVPCIKKNKEDLKVGETVQVNEPRTEEEIKEKFEYEELFCHIQSKIIRLTKLKENQENK
ncbi:MAG: glycosyltransferase family 39 protein [Bacteroidales bacterium]